MVQVQPQDVQAHVASYCDKYVIPTATFIRVYLLFGIGFTFWALIGIFAEMEGLGNPLAQGGTFMQEEFFPGVATALGSTVAAIICALVIEFVWYRHHHRLAQLERKATLFLLGDVQRVRGRFELNYGLESLAELYREVAASAKEASDYVASLTSASTIVMEGFNKAIAQFLQAAEQTQNLVISVERSQRAMEEQRLEMKASSEKLAVSVEGLKSIFETEASIVSGLRDELSEGSRSFINETVALREAINTLSQDWQQFLRTLGEEWHAKLQGTSEIWHNAIKDFSDEWRQAIKAEATSIYESMQTFEITIDNLKVLQENLSDTMERVDEQLQITQNLVKEVRENSDDIQLLHDSVEELANVLRDQLTLKDDVRRITEQIQLVIQTYDTQMKQQSDLAEKQLQHQRQVARVVDEQGGHLRRELQQLTAAMQGLERGLGRVSSNGGTPSQETERKWWPPFGLGR
ncbi:MAG: hypothetical protein KatS3mg042_1373 [Rhodothermaceae bacterium]|nr:MAG: hypothetical protein KatS3mg042_1373 [Rhodothermaceae bacterium]